MSSRTDGIQSSACVKLSQHLVQCILALTITSSLILRTEATQRHRMARFRKLAGHGNCDKVNGKARFGVLLASLHLANSSDEAWYSHRHDRRQRISLVLIIAIQGQWRGKGVWP